LHEMRAREIRAAEFPAREAELLREEYNASGGKEVFLSYEWKGRLVGFIRLRIPNSPFRKEIGGNTALIRELHVYGSEAPIGAGRREAQHRLFGSLLLKEAERIAKEELGKEEMVVISGVGAREYYYKKGYCPKGPYVSKALK
ncbi:MAG: GNAT family N-acetyltransferase, partial [Candidatus Bilamarchaeaceae archaeon]